MPVYKSPNDDNGYDISNYQDIMNKKVLSKYDIMTVGETPGTPPSKSQPNMLIGIDMNLIWSFIWK